jgi:hypothetical protein
MGTPADASSRLGRRDLSAVSLEVGRNIVVGDGDARDVTRFLATSVTLILLGFLGTGFVLTCIRFAIRTTKA